MTESTTQTLDSASRGVVTGGGIEEVRERVAVTTVPPSVEYEPNDAQSVRRTRWARDVYTEKCWQASASGGVVANRVGPCTRSRHG